MILEGCYPYVRGGVSSWMHEYIQGMPEHEFVLWVIGAKAEDKGKFKYELPRNVAEIHEVFLDDALRLRPTGKEKLRFTPEQVTALRIAGIAVVGPHPEPAWAGGVQHLGGHAEEGLVDALPGAGGAEYQGTDWDIDDNSHGGLLERELMIGNRSQPGRTVRVPEQASILAGAPRGSAMVGWSWPQGRPARMGFPAGRSVFSTSGWTGTITAALYAKSKDREETTYAF